MTSVETKPVQPRSPLKLFLIGCSALLGLCLFFCCVGSISSAVAYPFIYPPLPTQADAMVDLVDDQVAELRDLEFKRPVTFTLLTSAELRHNIEEDFAEEWTVDVAQDTVITMAAFDLLDPDFDLYNLYLDLYAEQIAGYYDPEEQTLYVISDDEAMNVSQRVTLAHELTHALQDQYFDLSRLFDEERETDAEADFAFQSLIEGGASLVQNRFLPKLAPHELPLLIQETLAMDIAIFTKSPAAVTESLLFPYREGLTFVTDLYEHGGWPAVNAAYANPPVSTEHILHPERYRAGDLPQLVTVPPLTDTLGSGWRWVDEDKMGEFLIRLQLSQQLTPTLVSEAASGWGGDQYAVYHHEQDQATVLLFRTVWDSPADATEFLSAYTLYLNQVAGFPPTHDSEQRYCWDFEAEIRCIVSSADEIIVIRAPDEALVERVLAAIK